MPAGADDWTVSIADWPSPVCRVESTGPDVVLGDPNDAFESTFGDVVGDPVVDAFETLAVAPVEQSSGTAGGSGHTSTEHWSDLDGWLARADPMPVRVTRTDDDRPTSAYLLQSVGRSSDSDGLLVFTPLPVAPTATRATEIDLDQVARVISHDLRNPLDVAKARLRAGREDGDDEQFEHVARAHDRMERIVDDVLTLSSGRHGLERTSGVALDDRVKRAWETVETGTARLVVESPLPSVAANRDRITRLFENLFRNVVEHGSTSHRSSSTREDAVEHSTPNSDASTGSSTAGSEPPSVTVTVGRLDDGEGVYVADDGRGIPRERRDRVFEPGYSSVDHGTGLGLAIVERIVTAHGWSITVSSATAGGARFEIRDLDRTGGTDS